MNNKNDRNNDSCLLLTYCFKLIKLIIMYNVCYSRQWLGFSTSCTKKLKNYSVKYNKNL